MSDTTCRQCAAPLPPASPGGAGACGACGTLFGLQSELEEYARAVLEGRSDVTRPASLPQSRMRVEWKGGGEDGYRGSGGGRLRIRLGYFNSYSALLWPVSLLALGAVGYGWWFVRGAFTWILVVPSLIIGLRALRRTLALFDRFELTLDEKELRSASSRFWPRRIVQIPRASLKQLFAIKAGRGYALLASAQEGKGRIVAFPVASAELAWYLERQVELAAGITDEAVSAELDRTMPAPKANVARMAAFETLFLALLAGGAVFGVRSCGVPLGTLAVRDTPQDLSVVLNKEGVLFFSAELDFAKRTYRSRDAVPRSLRYQIAVLQGDQQVHAMDCDPVNMFVWVSSTSNKNFSSIEGRMDGCSVRLPGGTYTVRVARTWQAGVPRVHYSTTKISPRLE